MPPQESEREKLLLDAVDKIPSARVLVVVAAGFSGLFSGAWWLGLDSAPDRWTGKDQYTYTDRHVKQHERDENNLVLRLATIKAVQDEHDRRIDRHVLIQEHAGADRRMTMQGNRLDKLVHRTESAIDALFKHTQGTEARVVRIANLEKDVAEIKEIIRNK